MVRNLDPSACPPGVFKKVISLAPPICSKHLLLSRALAQIKEHHEWGSSLNCSTWALWVKELELVTKGLFHPPSSRDCSSASLQGFCWVPVRADRPFPAAVGNPQKTPELTRGGKDEEQQPRDEEGLCLAVLDKPCCAETQEWVPTKRPVSDVQTIRKLMNSLEIITQW